MSTKEIQKLKREFRHINNKQLSQLDYERKHRRDLDRFILRRIPTCN